MKRYTHTRLLHFCGRPCAQLGTLVGLSGWDLPVGRGRLRIRNTTVPGYIC